MNHIASLSISASYDEKESKFNHNYSDVSIEILSNNDQTSAFRSVLQIGTMTDNINEVHSISNLQNETLLFKGYRADKLIAKTLQGHVFTAKILNDCIYGKKDDDVIIKTANFNWHQQGITITNQGKIIKIKENIFNEARILKLFRNNRAPNTCIKYYDFFWDKELFYLVEEKGGKSLFEFVVDCHKLIDNGKLSMYNWINIIKSIFIQMVNFIHWMHIKQKCCNLDISLENVVFIHNTNNNNGKNKETQIRKSKTIYK